MKIYKQKLREALGHRAVRRTLPKGPYSGMLGAAFGKLHHDFLKEELVFRVILS
ncbi:hypothetical protein [Acidaminococcus timonensis]|uniref:hypothetical protein n=1 Tax=Acidaminococcus timonensis TaxID=1871002 RepID=UPI003A5B99EC